MSDGGDGLILLGALRAGGLIVAENITASIDEHVKRILDSHLKVGKEKPVSYLPIKTVEDVIGITIQKYKSMIERLGSRGSVFSAEECCIKSGAVYAYSDVYLDQILKANKDVLSENGWPIVPDDFIRKIASEWLDDESPIMPVVKKAFGEV
jgi:hypothetical protein